MVILGQNAKKFRGTEKNLNFFCFKIRFRLFSIVSYKKSSNLFRFGHRCFWSSALGIQSRKMQKIKRCEIFFIFSPGTWLIERQWKKRQGTGVPLAPMVSLTIYFELEERMIPQNDTLGKANCTKMCYIYIVKYVCLNIYN